MTFRVFDGVPIYEDNDPNKAFMDILLPGELEFERARAGQEIPLNTAIVMPLELEDEAATLVIEFRRSDIQETFIRQLFFGEDPDLVSSHPMAAQGIESVLTDERLIVTVHPGVRLRLSNGTLLSPYYRTFADEDVTGRISAVRGEVYVSSDPQWTGIRLRDFYNTVVARGTSADGTEPQIEEQPDGSYVISSPAYAVQWPERYPPRVVAGP